MAAAAAILFEGYSRVYDAFGFEDPDGYVRGMRWGGYRPGESIELIQSKTDNVVDISIVDRLESEVVVLYPELEAVIGSLKRGADDDLIVRGKRTGAASAKNGMNKLHRRIRRKVGLPDDRKFTSFRDGAITDVGEVDVRAVSGHKSVNVTGIFNKASRGKALRISARRREQVTTPVGAIAEVEGDPEWGYSTLPRLVCLKSARQSRKNEPQMSCRV